MRLALFQPDQPQNVGTLMRLGACLGVAIDIVRPCGFPIGRDALRRSAMDYFDHADITIHGDWDAFRSHIPARCILLTTQAKTPYTAVKFRANDTILLGQESCGAPDFVHEAADLRATIPMQAGLRSINVALAGAMVVGEAIRQTGGTNT